MLKQEAAGTRVTTRSYEPNTAPNQEVEDAIINPETGMAFTSLQWPPRAVRLTEQSGGPGGGAQEDDNEPSGEGYGKVGGLWITGRGCVTER